MATKQRIFVIGSNSFSGSSFIDFLLEEGNFSLVGISRSPENNEVFLPYKRHSNADFTFYRMDLNNDMAKIRKLIDTFQPEYVVNFAAQSMVAESWQHPEHWMQTNITANILLHEHLRTCPFLQKYVHISTPEVYGNCQGLVRESADYHPSTPYAVSRAAADMSLMTFFHTYRFPVVFTRAANVFGPCQQLYRIIPKTILSFLTNRKIPLHGGGQGVRSFVHIRDVARGTILAALNSPPGEIYHFSTARNISIRSLVEQIAKQMDIRFEDFVTITADRPGKDLAYLLDNAKARTQLGWEDRISLENGIEETISWAKNNLERLRHLPLEYIHKQ